MLGPPSPRFEGVVGNADGEQAPYEDSPTRKTLLEEHHGVTRSSCRHKRGPLINPATGNSWKTSGFLIEDHDHACGSNPRTFRLSPNIESTREVAASMFAVSGAR